MGISIHEFKTKRTDEWNDEEHPGGAPGTQLPRPWAAGYIRGHRRREGYFYKEIRDGLPTEKTQISHLPPNIHANTLQKT